MNLSKQWFLALAVCLCSGLLSCEKQVGYKGIIDLKDGQWAINQVQNYSFEITDQAELQNIYFIVRNAADYPFYNLYVRYQLTDANGQKLKSELEELVLFEPKTGKPLGDSGLGNIYEHRFLAKSLKNVRFPKKGTYRLSLTQYMRQDPLKGILSVGIHVEPKK